MKITPFSVIFSDAKNCMGVPYRVPVQVILEILTSGLQFAYPTFDFSTFTNTWKYYLYTYLTACIKFGVSIFIIFGDTER